jgi:hypothetical protein
MPDHVMKESDVLYLNWVLIVGSYIDSRFIYEGV